MRLDELTLSLLEYVIKGSPGQSGKDYAYLYNKSLLLITQHPLESFYFILDPSTVKIAIEYLAQHGPESHSYNGVDDILKKDAISNKLTQHALAHMKPSVNLDPVLLDIFKEQASKPNAVASALATKLVYGLKIETRQHAQQATESMNIEPIRFSVHRPSRYVIIDHDNKYIHRIDKSAEYSTRMPTYGGKGNYVLIRGDFTMEGRDYVKTINQLTKMFPGYATDERDSTLLGAEKQKQQMLSGQGSIKVYHGTSESIWKQIKATGKMIPGQGPDYWDKIKGHSESMIYMTMDPDVARRYAIRAARASKYVILEIEISDFTKIRFDEDSLGSALRGVIDSNKKRDVAVIRTLTDHGIDIDNLYSFIKQHLAGTNSNVQIPNEKNIVRYILNRAMIRMGEYSFAYEGTIPLRNIKVFEVSKTKRYKDSDDYSQADYDELEQQAQQGRYPPENRSKR